MARFFRRRKFCRFTAEGTKEIDYKDLETLKAYVSETGKIVPSRITGTNGGYIEITNTLNAPSSANPGNLGAIFTSAANMGSTVIRRGHLSQVNGAGAGNSIHRYYDITPTTNTGLNASLRFQYFDAELNGLAENALMMWKSINNTSWTNEGFTTRDGTINYVEKTSIPGFSRWTLSSPGNPLPVVFSLFNVKCDNNKVEINWKTASEQNSDRFEVQHSGNGSLWTTIGTLPAAGNSTIEKSYSFIDNSPLASASFYRIAQFDIDGKIQYTGIIKNDCNHTGNIKLWPNPVVSQLYISITTTARSNTSINLYDAKGTLIRTQQTALITGNNLVNIDMSSLPNGIYHVAASWNQGSSQQSFKIIKQ